MSALHEGCFKGPEDSAQDEIRFHHQPAAD
jgi:hypothetical protein